MTPDRTSLSSISTPSIPITVQTADGSSLSVAGQGTLLSSSFHVPAVSYVPKLTMQLISADQLTHHGCRVILDSDSCCIQDCTGLLVGTSPRRRDSQRLFGSLTGFVFLPLPLPVLLGLLHLLHPHHLLLSGIIAWDISVARVCLRSFVVVF